MDTYKKILSAADPAGCKKLRKQVKHYDDKVWTNARYDVVLTGCRAKFEQNINHLLTMACQAFALGVADDSLVAAILLHDVYGDALFTIRYHLYSVLSALKHHMITEMEG